MIAVFEEALIFWYGDVAVAGKSGNYVSEVVFIGFEDFDYEMDMVGHYDIAVNTGAWEAVGNGADSILDNAPDFGVSDARIGEAALPGAEKEGKRLDAGLLGKSDEVGAFGAVVVVGAAGFVVDFHRRIFGDKGI